MNSMRMIFKYWAKSEKQFKQQIIILIFSTIFYTLSPVFIGRMIGALVNVENLLVDFILVVVLAFLVYITNRAARLKGAEVSSKAIYHLRTDISNAIYRQSFSFFDKTETGQLISRATSDIEETQQIFGMGLTMGIQAIFQLIGVSIGFFLFSMELSVVLIFAFTASLSMSYIIARKLKPIFLETRGSFGDLTNTIRENIVGAEVVRMFSTQNKEREKFQNNNERFYRASVDSVKYNSLYMPLISVVIGFMMVLIFFLGGMGYIEGDMTKPEIVTLISFIASLTFPIAILGQIMLVYVQADAALTRVREILESAPEVEDIPDAIPINTLEGEIIFDNVSFGYTSEHRILKDVSFTIPKGKKLAILGTTGSGKSTIINLIPRFYEINKGSIKIDGIDIHNYVLKDLRKNIGLVSQETYLFNKSIAENIAYGKEDAKQEEIMEAAKIAELHDFITTLPKGYDSIIGERGTRLSGGQKQRLSIARALIVKPSILVFDDSTSSVDVETEFKIQEALLRIMKDTTTIIITQRISTIRNADLILILDRGRVVGLGNHNNLIESNVLYKQIFETLYQKQKSKGGLINE
ncbi:MAG: ABC transporter ATP-binding protein [Candidatus Lokiarchaeota archaeon]|nr:ABC transporter ATP-binding protein [Candidatus Lokiarchaeota archaeon]